jgi:hypothetical protein
LADFLVDWAEAQYKPPKPDVDYWKMHFDGSKLKEGLGAGVVLTSPKGDHLRYVLQIHFRASNNVAEYEAWCMGLKLQKKLVHTGSFATAIRIWWYNSVPEIGMRRMPTWPHTGFMCRRLPDSSRAANFTMYREQKMKPRTHSPSWAHPGKKFLPE